MSHLDGSNRWLFASAPPVRSLQKGYNVTDSRTVLPAITPSLAADPYSALTDALFGLAHRSPLIPQQCSGPVGHIAHLLHLTCQRHLLLLVRDLVLCLKNASALTHTVLKSLGRGSPLTVELRWLCVQLQELSRHAGALQRRLRGDKFLQPVSSALHEAVGHMERAMKLLYVQVAALVERGIVSSLHLAVHFPETITEDLAHGLLIYNSVVAEGGMERPAFTVPRALEMLAEGRGQVLASKFCQALRGCEEVVDKCQSPGQWDSGILDIFSFSPPGTASAHSMGAMMKTLIQEDRRQIIPVLQSMVTSDPSMWCHNLNRPSTSMAQHGGHSTRCKEAVSMHYTQYCANLWQAFYSHLFHTLYRSQRDTTGLPALSVCAEGTCLAVIRILMDTLPSAPELQTCCTEGWRLCLRLLFTCLFTSWDRGFCQSLSMALTDKCTAMPSSSGVRSRTAGTLTQMCQQLAVLVQTAYSPDNGPGPISLSLLYALFSRCVVSLQLCDLWLRCRTQHFVSVGAIRPLLLLTYGDLQVLQAELHTLCSVLPRADSLMSQPLIHRTYLQILTVRDNMEVLAVSLPRSLGSVCSSLAEEVFQQLMPTGRYWRGKLTGDPVVSPSDYSLSALHSVLLPVLDGIRLLASSHQVSALSVTLSVFMDTWMGHILRERLRFSLQGALQLRCDFESVRGFLQSPSSGLSQEVVQVALSLPVFQLSDNVVICLLQQPSHKAYLRSRVCSLIWCCPPLCSTAVESVSDSLQSLDSLERRVWERHHSADLQKQSGDSYLPHNQRQWLSLRVHQGWGGLRVPWEAPRPSER
ncbi:coiled-coil domain-containing protein 142 [Discoglossus pictus]